MWLWLLVIEVAGALVSPKLSRTPAVKRHAGLIGQARCQLTPPPAKARASSDFHRTPGWDRGRFLRFLASRRLDDLGVGVVPNPQQAEAIGREKTEGWPG